MSNVLLLPKECEHGMPFLTGRPVRFLSVYLLNQCVSPPGRRPVRHLTGPFQVRQETATNASKKRHIKNEVGWVGWPTVATRHCGSYKSHTFRTFHDSL